MEEKANLEYGEDKMRQRVSNVIVLHDKSKEADFRSKNRMLMQGNYEFKFGSSTVSLKDKLFKVSCEPTAFHLYKRRDLEAKIDKLAINKLRIAKMIFNITQ